MSEENVKIIGEISTTKSRRFKLPLVQTAYQLDCGRLDVIYYMDKGFEVYLTKFDGTELNIHVDKAVSDLGWSLPTQTRPKFLTEEDDA